MIKSLDHWCKHQFDILFYVVAQLVVNIHQIGFNFTQKRVRKYYDGGSTNPIYIYIYMRIWKVRLMVTIISTYHQRKIEDIKQLFDIIPTIKSI
jgi:hypothetical protein